MSLQFKVTLAILVLLIAAGCGGGAEYYEPASTEAPAEPFLFEPVNTPTLPAPESTTVPEAVATEAPAPTEVPLRTETVSPSPEPPAPTLQTPEPTWTPAVPGSWSGQPTYPESAANMFFLLTYDFSVWNYGEDDFGLPNLSHRSIPGCSIAPTVGRGLSPDWTVEDTFRPVGALTFEVVVASQNGQVKFVNYYGGDGTVFTGFQVTFNGEMEACLRDAETVLATLSSVTAPTEMLWPEATATP
jgi:hypothetical protein